MKKTIRGSVYDTEKATLVNEYKNGFYKNSPYYCYERLYRTDKGRWFIYGVGGEMSRWASHLSGARRGPGEGIQSLTEDEAQKWRRKKFMEESEKQK